MGRVGPGRAAQYEQFPLVDDELARPSASLVMTAPPSWVYNPPTSPAGPPTSAAGPAARATSCHP